MSSYYSEASKLVLASQMQRLKDEIKLAKEDYMELKQKAKVKGRSTFSVLDNKGLEGRIATQRSFPLKVIFTRLKTQWRLLEMQELQLEYCQKMV